MLRTRVPNKKYIKVEVFGYLEVWYEAVTQCSQQLEQQINVRWMMTEIMQQYLYD